MTNRESFIFYRSFYEALIGMDKNSQADCLMAVADYALNGKEPSLTPEVRLFFTLVKPQIDANNKKFENGCKGGRPKNQTITKQKPKENHIITKQEPNVNDNDNVNVNVNVKVKNNRYGECKNVLLTEEQYKTLSKLYPNLCEAIEKLDTWLGTSGSKNRNKNHYAYFKSNSWVWEKLKPNNNQIETKQTEKIFIDENTRIDETIPEFNDMKYEECCRAYDWLQEKMYCQTITKDKFVEIVRKFKNNSQKN